jgi:ABC-type multidrug transport system fused ATPase/permease subunit
MEADYVIYIKDGTIEIGTPRELMAKDSCFKRDLEVGSETS